MKKVWEYQRNRQPSRTQKQFEKDHCNYDNLCMIFANECNNWELIEEVMESKQQDVSLYCYYIMHELYDLYIKWQTQWFE